MEKQKNVRNGFIRLILLAIVVIALLAYFKIDTRVILDNPIVQKLINVFVVAWGTYIKPMLMYFWTSVWGVFHR